MGGYFKPVSPKQLTGVVKPMMEEGPSGGGIPVATWPTLAQPQAAPSRRTSPRNASTTVLRSEVS